MLSAGTDRLGRLRSATSPVSVEALEDRRLFAVSLQPGFTYTTAYTIPVKEASNMVFGPGGRIFYAEKFGSVRVIAGGGLKADPVLSVTVDARAERGLTGLELDPNFASNGFLYVFYTRPDPAKPNEIPSNAKSRVSRFKIDLATNKRDPSVPEKILLDNIPATSGFHNGGGMHFGTDGKLYIGVGEAGLPQASGVSPASDLNSLSGKILRINSDGSIPGDNPFANQAGKRGEVWAYGLRNPFTSAVQPGTGRFYANDVGSNKFEEVNNIVKGGNYGWPKYEGYSTAAGYQSPVYAYSHKGGQAAVTGGVFLNNTNFPAALRGNYVFTDAYIDSEAKFLRMINPNTGEVVKFGTSSNFATGVGGFLDLDVGPDGALYALAPYSGKIVRIGYTNGGSTNQDPVAAATANKTSGPAPLDVNFSSAGSNDPDGNPLSYLWNFGDGTTSTAANPSHTYDANGTYKVTLTVSDGKGGSDVTDPITVAVGNTAPTATLNVNAAGLVYDGGEIITWSATGNDAEDGALPASAFHLNVELHHLEHTHPFLDVDGQAGGSFNIPRDVENSPVQWYRLTLTATDSKGVSTTVVKDIQPHLTKLTLASNVAGIKVNLDGAAVATPTTNESVAGNHRVISAPASQVVNGKTYKFVSWSDGGAASHLINFPTSNATITATYEASDGSTPSTNKVNSLTLINADTEGAVRTLVNNDVIDLSKTPRVNIRAEIGSGVGSVSFKLNGVVVRTESYLPFAIADNDPGVYSPYNFTPGSYTLVVTPYSAKSLGGTVGTPLTIKFTVTGTTPTVQQGLKATYYNNMDFTGTTFSRTDATLNFAWGAGSPNAAIGADTFSARWVGKIKAPTTGTYTIYTQSDNGVKVWINGKLVVNAYDAHPSREDKGTIALTAGVKYDIKVEYFENLGDGTMKLSWSGPGIGKQIVPGSALTTA